MQRALVGTCAVAVLILGALLAGCAAGDATSAPATASAASAGSEAPPSPSTAAATPPGPPPVAGEVLFTDEMDDDANGWGEGDGISFVGGEYVFSVQAPEKVATWPDALVGATPDAVVVTARLSAATADAALAVACNMTQDGSGGGRFYALGIGPDGALISRTTSTALTPLFGVLATAPMDVDLTVPHDVQGACVPAGDEMHLWLSLDGRPVLSVVDPDPLGAGPPGINLAPGPDAPQGSPFEARAASFSVATPARTS